MLTLELHMERTFVPINTEFLFITVVCKPGGLQILDFPEDRSCLPCWNRTICRGVFNREQHAEHLSAAAQRQCSEIQLHFSYFEHNRLVEAAFLLWKEEFWNYLGFLFFLVGFFLLTTKKTQHQGRRTFFVLFPKAPKTKQATKGAKCLETGCLRRRWSIYVIFSCLTWRHFWDQRWKVWEKNLKRPHCSVS